MGRNSSFAEIAMAREIIISLLFLSVFASAFIIENQDNPSIPITGFAVSESFGCCEDLCTQAKEGDCSGEFHKGKECKAIERCLIGCCADTEGYCLQNYLQGNCLANKGKFIGKQCGNIPYCTIGSDKPRIKKAGKVQRQVSAVSLTPSHGYLGSFIPLLYVVPERDVLRVQAEILDDERVIALVELHDDGAHSDGGEGDGLYGNLWDSSVIGAREGSARLIINIIISKNGEDKKLESTQNITILTTNRCFPLDYAPEPLRKKNIVIVQKGYPLQPTFRNKAAGISSRLFPDNSPQYRQEFSIFRIDRSMGNLDLGLLESAVRLECTFFNSSKDSIIAIDDGKDCEESGQLITLASRFLLRNSIANFSFTSLKGICSHIISERMFLDELNRSISPPRFVFYSENFTFADVTSVNISLTINDASYPVRLTVERDGMLIHNSSVQDDFPVKVEVPINETFHVLDFIARNSRQVYSSVRLNITSSFSIENDTFQGSEA